MKKVSPGEFIAELEKKQTQIESEIGKGLAQSCALIQREAQESMRNTKVNGAVSYYTHNKNIAHHPSLPDNPPAIDTGTLLRSITYEVNEERLEGRVGSVLTDPPYGAYLELAEYGSSKMRPRPWLKPATEKSAEDIRKILANAVGRGLKK